MKHTVNARDLHEALGHGRDFSTWFNYQVNLLQLVENVDYGISHANVGNPKGGRPVIDYELTLDSAKHIALSSQTEKGYKYRQALIYIEKDAQDLATLKSIRAWMSEHSLWSILIRGKLSEQ